VYKKEREGKRDSKMENGWSLDVLRLKLWGSSNEINDVIKPIKYYQKMSNNATNLCVESWPLRRTDTHTTFYLFSFPLLSTLIPIPFAIPTGVTTQILILFVILNLVLSTYSFFSLRRQSILAHSSLTPPSIGR
jgi:hypothetical protein